jgi:hypothetical protein
MCLSQVSQQQDISSSRGSVPADTQLSYAIGFEIEHLAFWQMQQDKQQIRYTPAQAAAAATLSGW